MSTIYIVVGDNGLYDEDADWWNVKAFTNEQKAILFANCANAEIVNALHTNAVTQPYEALPKDFKSNYDDSTRVFYFSTSDSVCPIELKD